MPVHRAELHAQAHLAELRAAAPHDDGGLAPYRQAAQQVQTVQAGQQIEKGVGRVAVDELPGVIQLLPRQQLAGQECEGEQPRRR